MPPSNASAPVYEGLPGQHINYLSDMVMLIPADRRVQFAAILRQELLLQRPLTQAKMTAAVKKAAWQVSLIL
jgi:hypothetical protein